MKSIPNIVVAGLLLALFLNLAQGQTGTVGCDSAVKWCRRFCSGSLGDWCYTAQNCTETACNEGECSSILPIPVGANCNNAAPDCVTTCP